MKTITQEEVLGYLTDFINNNVSRLRQDDHSWKNHYDSVMIDLEYEIKSTEELIEDFTESKLTFNKIEQEGYLRCLKTMYNRFKEWEKQ